MNLEFIKKNYHITTFILLYFSIILGFILGENTTLGPKYDFFYALKQLEFFEQDFKFGFNELILHFNSLTFFFL